MQKGNVLVVGNSGVGKSTLINAVLGKEVAKTGFGIEGTQKRLDIYESEEIPFRIIDTMGFEPTFLKQWQAINAVKDWSKKSAQEGNEDTQINVIWFCVEGTSSKLFPKTIENLSKATAMWKSIPIITVITKSYAEGDRVKNIEMVQHAFATQKKSKNLKKIIPVVAEMFKINDFSYAPPEGITELIDATNKLIPEGIQAATNDLANFKLNRKRMLAQSTVAGLTLIGVGVGAVPLPIPDAAVLTPLEALEINAIAKVYGINQDENSKKIVDTIINAGVVGMAAKTAVSALKAIPGINIGGVIINAIVAGGIVATIGEGSIYIFEQIYLGKKSYEDIDWVTKVIESKFTNDFIKKLEDVAKKLDEDASKEEIAKLIMSAFKTSKNK